MTTTVRTDTRQTLTRSWRDIDPKVAIVALVTILASIALFILWLLGKIDTTTLGAGVGPAAVATLLGYAKRSSHRDLVFAAEQGIREAEALTPVLTAALPAAQPVVDEAESILSAVGLGPDPVPAAPTEVVPAAPVTTAPLTLSANGGGQ